MPLLASPTVLAIIFGVAVIAAFGGGFALADWRKNGQIEKIEGDNRLLETVNGRCATDIKAANAAIDSLKAQTLQREREAEKLMKEAQPQVTRRTTTITRIKALPAVAIDQQCEAIKQEQIAYVRERRAE